MIILYDDDIYDDVYRSYIIGVSDDVPVLGAYPIF